MMQTRIGRPFLTPGTEGRTRLAAKVVGPDGTERELWFEVEASYAPYLVVERADAFLVGLIPFVALQGGRVVCEAPVSAHLLHGLRHLLSPALPRIRRGLSPLDIVAEGDDRILGDGEVRHVGTGVSCGIDSMATICTYTAADVPAGLKVDTLCYFDLGSHGDGFNPTEEELAHARELAEVRGRNVAAFAAEIGLPILRLRSNVHEFSLRLIHQNVHTFRNTAAVLALQRYFVGYHYASAYHVAEFRLTLDNCAYMDEFLLRCLSTETVTFHSALPTLTRHERTSIVARYAPARHHLNVCVKEGGNCGRCVKCARTAFQLELNGALDDFVEVFDVADYRASRRRTLGLLAKDEHFHGEYLAAATACGHPPYSVAALRTAFAVRRVKRGLVALRKFLFGGRRRS